MQRLRRVGGDHLDRFEQRQAGLDAAHDHVDGVRQRLEEGLLAALLQEAQPPARQAEAGGKGKPGGAEQSAAGEPARRRRTPRRARPRKCRISAPSSSRPAWVRRALSGTLLCLSRRASRSFSEDFDLLAARALALFVLALGGRLRLGDGGAAVFGLLLAREQGIDEDPGHAADGDGGEEGESDGLHVHGASPSGRGLDFGGVERRGEALLLAVVAGALPEARPADAGGAVLADDLAVGVLADQVVEEDVLGDDGVAFHAHHLGDVGDAARAVAQARGLDDDVDRGADHLADGSRGKREAAHGDHGFAARQRFARIVGVQRAHRAVMAGVHGLQQVERLGSADFADDDAFGTHTQAVAHQFAHGDLAFAFDVRRAGFQPHHMRLLQLKLGGVLAGDDALVVLDIVGQAVQQRGLAGAGTAGDQHVAADAADDLQDLRAFRRDRAELDQLVERQLVLLEFADGERGAVDRERRHDGVDAGAVGEAGVADRRGFVDAPADLADDALADVEQLLVVAEADAGALDLAGDFDEDRAGAVHHDVGDVVARQQRLERAVAEHVVADVVEQLFLLGDRHHDVLDRDDLVDDVADFLARRLAVELGELGEVDRLDQRAEDRRLDLVVIVGLARLRRPAAAAAAARP